MGTGNVFAATAVLAFLLFPGCSGAPPELRTVGGQENASAPAASAPGAPAAGKAGEAGPSFPTWEGPVPAGPGKAAEAIGGYPYKGKPVFLVGDRPVTEEELTRYKVRMVPPGMQGHGGAGMDNLVRSFAFYWATVELGVKEGVPASKPVRDVLDVYTHMALANDYRAHLEKTTVLAPEEVKGLTRENWTRMRFLMRTYPSQAEAEKAHLALLGKKGKLSKVEFEKEMREEFKSDSGLIFRDSGFFTSFDDHYLFGLKQGEISRPVETGVGIGICFVALREDMDAAGIKEYVRSEEEKLVRARVAGKLDALTAAEKSTLHRENFDKAVVTEGRTGNIVRDPVLTLPAAGGDIVVRYNDFRSLIPGNYGVFFKQYPAESWKDFVEPNLKSLAGTYAIGREAKKQGIRPSEKWEKELFDFKVKTVYLATLERLGSKESPRIGNAEVRRFYDENRGLFSHDVILKISYFYAPEKGGLESLAKTAGSREALFGKKDLERLRRKMYLTRGSQPHAELYGKAKDLKAGAVSPVLKADMGYYVVKVEERREKGFAPFEEVRGDIRSHLEGQVRDERVNETIAARVAGMPIRKL